MKFIQAIIKGVAGQHGQRFKAYAWGQHDDHRMDWHGTNYRTLSLPGQPQRGFATSAEAAAWVRAKWPTEAALAHWARYAGNGTHLGDGATFEPVKYPLDPAGPVG